MKVYQDSNEKYYFANEEEVIEYQLFELERAYDMAWAGAEKSDALREWNYYAQDSQLIVDDFGFEEIEIEINEITEKKFYYDCPEEE